MREIIIPRLVRQPSEQLEGLRQRGIGGNRDFLDGVELEPLYQRVVGARLIKQLAVDHQPAILCGHHDTLSFQHRHERPELDLLVLFRVGIAKQVQGPREQFCEFLRRHRGAQFNTLPAPCRGR